MRRVISLYLPHWPSNRPRRMRREFAARDKPLVTAMMQGQRRILASVDEAAARVGLSIGMTVTKQRRFIVLGRGIDYG
jgi:protein ImuB